MTLPQPPDHRCPTCGACWWTSFWPPTCTGSRHSELGGPHPATAATLLDPPGTNLAPWVPWEQWRQW